MKSRSSVIAPPTTVPWTMSPAAAECSTRSWTRVSIRRGPVSPRIAIGALGQLGGGDHAGTHRIVDVVVDVGDAVDEADDLALEGGGLSARDPSG